MKRGTMYQTLINIYLIIDQYKITLGLIYQINIKHNFAKSLLTSNLVQFRNFK